MTTSGVANKSELDMAVEEFESYAQDVKKRFDGIILSDNKQDKLNALDANERMQVLNYEKLTLRIDQLVRERLRKAMSANDVPRVFNAVDKPVAFRVQRSRSHDALTVNHVNHDENAATKQAPIKKRSQ